jgi:hypothetical protein
MSILGSVGSLYMSILILLLIISFGLVGLKLINYVLGLEQIGAKNNGIKTQNNNPETRKWLKLALYSFIGILISIFILSILNSSLINSSHM